MTVLFGAGALALGALANWASSRTESASTLSPERRDGPAVIAPASSRRVTEVFGISPFLDEASLKAKVKDVRCDRGTWPISSVEVDGVQVPHRVCNWTDGEIRFSAKLVNVSGLQSASGRIAEMSYDVFDRHVDGSEPFRAFLRELETKYGTFDKSEGAKPYFASNISVCSSPAGECEDAGILVSEQVNAAMSVYAQRTVTSLRVTYLNNTIRAELQRFAASKNADAARAEAK